MNKPLTLDEIAKYKRTIEKGVIERVLEIIYNQRGYDQVEDIMIVDATEITDEINKEFRMDDE